MRLSQFEFCNVKMGPRLRGGDAIDGSRYSQGTVIPAKAGIH